MRPEDAPELTVWLKRMSAGEAEAAEHVAAIVYKELHRLAAYALLGGPSAQNSLQPTLLVNEAFLRLLTGQPVDWQDRQHFFALASRLMRRIVVDHFRSQGAAKRVPKELLIANVEELIFDESRQEEALMVDEALEKLGDVDARAAKVVEMRYFGGLTTDQTAEALGISPKTVKRDWDMAIWWLRRYFGSSASEVATA